MKNLRIINYDDLKDWAKEIIWSMFHLKKKRLEEL